MYRLQRLSHHFGWRVIGIFSTLPKAVERIENFRKHYPQETYRLTAGKVKP